MRLELDAPNLGSLEKRYVSRAIDSGFVSTFGPYVSLFEEKFADYLGVKKAVSTQSGTSAIHIALYELGIGPGDEVIVPALTFVASINPVKYVGATPVFVDVDIKTWNISPIEIEKNITRRTKAIIPVHLYGNPCKMDSIMKIARKYKLYVIEDATESLGAKYKGRYTGTIGTLGCFSFNGNKIITTGGGGMVAGDDEVRLRHIKFLGNQARDESLGYFHPEIGFNYRMTNLESALGLAQMKRLCGFLKKRKIFNDIYKEELKDIPFISFQESYKEATSSYWSTCIVFDKKVDLSSLQEKLKSQSIPTRRIFMPITEFPPYRKYKRFSYKNAYYIYHNGLYLPSSALNFKDDIYFVCKAINNFFS